MNKITFVAIVLAIFLSAYALSTILFVVLFVVAVGIFSAKSDYPGLSTKKHVLTQRFNLNPSEKDSFDTIVIGSGISGLTTATVLARMTKKKILVLEQHDRVGGGHHTFELSQNVKYSFDSGLHYVVPYCQDLLHLACGSSQPPVIFDKMGEDDDCFDEVITGDGKIFQYKHGEKHLPLLYQMFPEEKDKLDQYMRDSDEALSGFQVWMISKLFPLWVQENIFQRFLFSKFYKTASLTAKQYFDKLGMSNRLTALLNGLWLDTGCPPTTSSFILSACVFRGLPKEGGAYPRGGCETLGKAMIPVIEHYGGKVFVRAAVDKIIIENGVACGVLMENGMELRCNRVISSCGYITTYNRLVPEHVTQKLGIPRTPPEITTSAGFVMANIGIKGNPKDLNIPCKNLWYIPISEENDFNIFTCIDDFLKSPDTKEPCAMFTFPSVKDRGYKDKEHLSCQMLILAEYSWFENWKNYPSGKRGEDYLQVKAKWEQRCRELLIKHYPQLKDTIEFIDISTPLSIQHYLNAPNGGAVGLDSTPPRFVSQKLNKFLETQSQIPQLFLTGQDFLLCGQPLCQISGFATATRIAGISSLIKLIANQSAIGLQEWFKSLE